MAGDSGDAVVGSLGVEWIVDAEQCTELKLRDAAAVQELVEVIAEQLDLHAVAEPLVYVSEGDGGVTTLVLLSESHLTVHTFPESRAASVNLYSRLVRPAFNWSRILEEKLGARLVSVRALRRGTKA
jgi:S-adenosylmethionine/arginine decarboxylase-like enzyme